MHVFKSFQALESKKRSPIFFILPFVVLVLLSSNVFSQDPNFHIYLCFGQSNMDGPGTIEPQDRTVDSRFKVFMAMDCPGIGRTKANWYTAEPPLCRCTSGLSPADYFGRTMVKHLPDSITIGVINVSIPGCKIEAFDQNGFDEYVESITADWLINFINGYDGNPYQYLVDLAKLAQQDGVIKGFLLHQGESNTGDEYWPSKVRSVYDSLINDLGLNPEETPLLAGELVNKDQGGACASMNTIIANLPDTLPNSYVISSSECTDKEDNIHFNAAGLRKFGARYAYKMLSFYGLDIQEPVEVIIPPGTDSIYLEAECAVVGEKWNLLSDTLASNEYYVEITPGLKGMLSAPTDSASVIEFTFEVDSNDYYDVFARVNCATGDDDSFWLTLDNKQSYSFNGLVTNGWEWKELNTYLLTKGEHTLKFSYREDGAKLDKLFITNFPVKPSNVADNALNLCNPQPDSEPTGIQSVPNVSGYKLGASYPNPFNNSTSISFTIPVSTVVSVKIYSILGEELKELAGERFLAGKHTLEFNSGSLPDGNYIVKLKTAEYTATQKIIKYSH